MVQSLTCVHLFETPRTAAPQASLSFTTSQGLLKLVSIASVMPSNHLILCHPLLLLPSVFPGIRVFSNELALRMRWPKYWSLSFSIHPSNKYSGLISFGTIFITNFNCTDFYLQSEVSKLTHTSYVTCLLVADADSESRSVRRQSVCSSCCPTPPSPAPEGLFQPLDLLLTFISSLNRVFLEPPLRTRLL